MLKISHITKRKINLYLFILRNKYLTIYSFVKFVFVVLISFVIYTVFLCGFTIYVQNSKIIYDIIDIPDEFVEGVVFIYNNDDYFMKKQIIEHAYNSYTLGKIKKIKIIVFNENSKIVEDNTIFSSIFRDLPTGKIDFDYKHVDALDFCINTSIYEYNRFVSFASRNILLEILSYCNYFYKHTVGVLAYHGNEYSLLYFVTYTVRLLYTIFSLSFNNYKFEFI
ncbi:MAG: hypothetical protein NZZ41_02445 [Candidatus Dojkabacteria bacterium]|nr:hypothetical protein [Candidatus Dojkabacteria bacterium]